VRNAIRRFNPETRLNGERGEEDHVATRNDDDVRGIDPALRQRVIDGMSVVTDALEATVANPSDSNLDELHESTDRLMRALGRVLIEVELQRKLPLV
jgi:hypothetical protein